MPAIFGSYYLLLNLNPCLLCCVPQDACISLQAGQGQNEARVTGLQLKAPPSCYLLGPLLNLLWLKQAWKAKGTNNQPQNAGVPSLYSPS